MLKRMSSEIKDWYHARRETRKVVQFVRQFCSDNYDSPNFEHEYLLLCLKKTWVRGPFKIEHSKFSSHVVIRMYLSEEEVLVFRDHCILPFINEWRVRRDITCEYMTTTMLTLN